MRILISLVSGALFGLGLIISGMTDTKKVQGWLDIFGEWDPTLAFVMGGAMLPMVIAWKATRVRTPLTADKFPATNTAGIDRDLIIGSVFFGIGWGLAGLCPGPGNCILKLWWKQRRSICQRDDNWHAFDAAPSSIFS
jgi:uncharacterized membrane protein YedE/YeeE